MRVRRVEDAPGRPSEVNFDDAIVSWAEPGSLRVAPEFDAPAPDSSQGGSMMKALRGAARALIFMRRGKPA